MILQEYNLINQKLFDTLPRFRIVECVENAYSSLINSMLGKKNIYNIFIENQTICSLFHSLIVTEIIHYDSDWRSGIQGNECDLVHKSGISLQIKTKSSVDGIAGNRYFNKNVYSPNDEFYICVNFLPFDSICKIRAGLIKPGWWKSQSGNGNSAVVKKEYLDFLPTLFGSYIKDLNFASISSFGKKTINQLKKMKIDRLCDLHNEEKYRLMKDTLSKNKIKNLLPYFAYAKERIYYEKNHKQFYELYEEQNIARFSYLFQTKHVKNFNLHNKKPA